MVYCGKPSRGCQMCRTRRIKCDEAKPTCMQCQKSRRQCPGYKDDFDLVFRNETKATERRARRAANNNKMNNPVSSEDNQSAFSSTNEYDGTTPRSQALIASSSRTALGNLVPVHLLTVPIQEQAPCFFIASYVISNTHASRGYFDFLIPMMKVESADSHLAVAFSAVALASLANRPNSKGSGLVTQAISQYSRALKAINLALQDPALQKSDQTLAAVLMLGFFETVMNERNNALAWGSHVEGAVQLVKMRGKKQLRTKVGQSLFVCVRTQMSVNCITGSKPPILGIDFWFPDTMKDDYSVFITRLSLRVAALRAEVNNALASFPRTPEYFQRVLNLMKRAQALEAEYLVWEDKLPESWRPRTVAWVDQIPGGDISKAEVCPGRVDMCNDIWISLMWNHARVSRLYISSCVVRCAAWICSPVDYRTTPEYATASKLCADLVQDIIASVPYHLGWRVGQGGALKAGHFDGFASGAEIFTSPKALGGFFSMYPILCVMCTDYISDSQRAWAKGRLVFISEVMGLNHAKVLSALQLRLPSMIIRRDSIVQAPQYASVATGTTPRGTHISPPLAASVPSQSASTANPSATSVTSLASANDMGQSNSSTQNNSVVYPLTPTQQMENMQKEQWERDRKQLLKKASNSQGDSVERLLANYLAV